MSNTPPRIFLSHAEEDIAFAERLAGDLRARGLDVWLDASHLGAGDFLTAISQALSQRDVLALVLTPAALASQWVPLEVNAAIVRSRQGFMRPPIIVTASSVPLESIPPLWAPFNRIDATTNYSAALPLVFRALGVPPATPSAAVVALPPSDQKLAIAVAPPQQALASSSVPRTPSPPMSRADDVPTAAPGSCLWDSILIVIAALIVLGVVIGAAFAFHMIPS